MSHEIINAVDALFTRLQTAADADNFNLITNPASEEVITIDDLPHVRVFPTRTGQIRDTALNARGGFEITLLLRLREDPQHGLFNDEKTRGILWLLEKVANAIDGSDMSASGAWMNAPQWSIADYVINDTALQIDINLLLTSARFTRGNL